MNDSERAKQIRKELKEKLGFNSKHVGVNTKNCSINVKIKSLESWCKMTEIEEIASQYESIDRCEFSGEILSGGNTFVFVSLDWEFEKALEVNEDDLWQETIVKAVLTGIHKYAKTFGIMTAENPMGIKLSHAENRALQE